MPAGHTAQKHAHRPWRRLARGLLVVVAALVLVAGAAFVWALSHARGNRPRLDGEIAIAALAEPVTVERDSLGVPTIRARGRRDLAAALGFVHAQERFFQMDLLRRQPAGEMAAFLGPAVARLDSAARVHQFRPRAERVLAACTAYERDLLDAYADGVNAGLGALDRRPLEYLLLRTQPEPWRPADSLLALYAMFNLLNGENESSLAVLYDVLPRPLADFLAARGSEWDAPLIGGLLPGAPVPRPDVIDLRRGETDTTAHRPLVAAIAAGPLRGIWLPNNDGPADDPVPGSNNWAMAGWRTRHGGALLANDMHLAHTVPNTWFRAVMIYPDSTGDSSGIQVTRARQRRVVGVTLPGVPALVAGSNGDVAWGFTNSFADCLDLVVVEVDSLDDSRYLTPDGPRPFERQREIIAIRGAAPDTIEIVTTVWGPIAMRDHRGRPLAMRWTAHEADGANLRLLEMEAVRSVSEALAVAPHCGIPPQNIVCADRDGHIGWTIIGRIPRRDGWDGRLPVSWADGAHRWDGWLAGEEYPRLVDPPSGQLWTANNRTVDGEALARVGDAGYILGARARQIRDDLLALDAPDERDMLAVQLDDSALFLARWRDLLLAVLTPDATAGSPQRAEFRSLVDTTWTGRASIESVAYRLVRAYRLTLHDLVYRWLTARCAAAWPDFDFNALGQWEQPLWILATERPLHLLDARHATWEDALLAAVDSTVAGLIGTRSDAAGDRSTPSDSAVTGVDTSTTGGAPPASPPTPPDRAAARALNSRPARTKKALADCTWGERNTVQIRHPISLAVPALGRWLDMPARQLPGDGNMPRVQSPDLSASERLVVSPGREEGGLFHMPCGQSGHPLSPYYRRGHEAWAEGRPTPLLGGPVVWRLILVPGN